jgi:hypothetical protein
MALPFEVPRELFPVEHQFVTLNEARISTTSTRNRNKLSFCCMETFTNAGRSYVQQGGHPFACLRNSKTHLP